MTDNQIIQGLKCCTGEQYVCSSCPYVTIETLGLEFTEYDCSWYLRKDALDLINRERTLAESWKRLYDNTCTELKEILALESEIKQEAIKEFLEELKKITVPIMFGNECRKVISEQGIDAIAERMGVNK